MSSTLLLLLALLCTCVNLGQAFLVRSGCSVDSRMVSRLHAGFGKTSAASQSPKKKLVADVKDGTACKCLSDKPYDMCCKPFHVGTLKPDTTSQMVRSRFSALAYGLDPSYLMATTAPSHKEYAPEDRKGKRSKWKKRLESFAAEYDFVKLEFDDEEKDSKSKSVDGDEAQIKFTATLNRKGHPDSAPEILVELSTFKKDEEGGWLYSAGETQNDFTRAMKEPPKSNRMITTVKRGVTAGN